MNTIYMNFPLDTTGINPMFDGGKHEIMPHHLYPINLNGQNFYIMTYKDITLDKEAITLIANINNIFIKIPIDDYNFLIDLLKNNPLKPTTVTLPNEILLGEFMRSANLKQEIKLSHIKQTEEPVYKQQLFVPRNENEDGLIEYRIFENNVIIMDEYGTQTYNFTTPPSMPSRDALIKLNNDGRNKTMNFKIRVLPNTPAVIKEVSKDGRVSKRLVYLLPGLHEYTITYSNYQNNEIYQNTAYASNLRIKTNNHYRGSFNVTEAFIDAGLELLPVELYNCFGENLGNSQGTRFTL